MGEAGLAPRGVKATSNAQGQEIELITDTGADSYQTHKHDSRGDSMLPTLALRQLI